MRTQQLTLAAVLAAVLIAGGPGAAQAQQKPPADTVFVPDTTPGRVLHRAAAFPVWVAVADVGGAVRAAVHVQWSKAGSSLPFASGLAEGDVEVLLPKTGGGTCVHTGAATAHGTVPFIAATPPEGCPSPPVRLLGGVSVTHKSTGSSLACVKAERSTSPPRGRVVRLRVFGCYWAEKPGGG